MRRIFLLCMLMVLAFSSRAFSAGQLEREGTLVTVKIGFVNLQQALNESEAGKKAKTELEAIIKQKQENIEAKVAEHKKFKEDMEKQAVVLSDEALKKRKEELDRMERDVQRLITESNNEVQKLQREREVAILKEIDALITKLGKEEHYTLILPAETVLYSPAEADITERLIKMYNESKKSTEGKKNN